MVLATLTTKGQIMIPKAIRDRLGLHPGDQIDFILQDDGSVVLRPATEDVRLLSGVLSRPNQEAVSLDEMAKAVRKRETGSG